MPSIIHENVKNALFHYEFVQLIIRLIESGLVPSSQILIEVPLAGKAGRKKWIHHWKNEFDILPSGQKVILPKNI